MNPSIDIIGIGADGPAGLRPEVVERIATADFLAGGERNLGHFPRTAGERFVIKDNLVALLEELNRRHPVQRCVVLASGDPLFYGVGTYILRTLGSQAVRVEPALSSMQLAFARARLPWQDATLASIHGRDIRTALLPLLGRPKIGLFTQDGRSPARAAGFFQRHGLAEYYAACVGENLGCADERTSFFADLRPLLDQQFAPLNFLVLHRIAYPSGARAERRRAMVPGVPDEAFIRPSNDHVMTRREVRSVLLGKMIGPLRAGDIAWDIGAGLGTVAVELAVLRPSVEVLAVEVRPERAAYIRRNRERFEAFNVRVIEGPAPQVLEHELDSPRVAFLGGSSGNLLTILEAIDHRLRAGGRIVATFVTLENLTTALQHYSALGWQFDVTEVHVARSDTLGRHTGLKPQRGVFVLSADKPRGLR